MRVPLTDYVVAICLAVALASTGCSSGETADGADSTSVINAGETMESDAENVGQSESQQAVVEKDEKKKKPKREKSTSVNVSKSFSGDLVIPVIAEGTIRARHSAEVTSEISERVEHVYVEEGQRVRRGQLLVKLDDREYEAAVEEARAAYLQALSLLTIEGDDVQYDPKAAKETRDQFANLEKQERAGKITREERVLQEVQNDLDAIRDGKFRYEVAAARSGVSRARAELERARINLERTAIRAPFAGVVTGLTLSNGERLSVNESICTIIDNVNIEADVGVLEADLANVEVGKLVLLDVPALGEVIRAQVDVVSPQFDRDTRTCQILIRVKNIDGRLLPGMFVRALIAGKIYNDRLLVPREAILTREGRPLIFKVDDSRAQWLYVELGKSNEHLVEIKKVLRGGQLVASDEVVISNHLTLAHDAKVKVKKTVPIADPWMGTDGESE